MTKKDDYSIKNKNLKNVLPIAYEEILEDIKRKVKDAQLHALKVVNKQLILIYKEIGRIIYEQQQEISWGNFCSRATR